MYLKRFPTFQGSDFKTIFEADGKKRPLDKRKREKNADPSDIEGYLGPWAKYKDEETVSRPGNDSMQTHSLVNIDFTPVCKKCCFLMFI